MAEVEDGSLTLEARITLMDKDVQNMKSQLNDIGKTGERVGNMLDNSLTAGFSGLGNVITDVSQQVISKLEEMLNQGKASAGAIVDETEKVQEKLDEVGKDKNSFDGVKEGAKSASEEVGNKLVDAIEKAKKSLLALGAGFSAKEIIGQIGSIRSEFQQLEVSFETMLGSKELSDQLMNQLVNTAAHTPFDLKGIADGARQLLAYGAAAEDVNDTLVMLGDIAAGLSMPLGDLVYLYGTTMTQGRVFAQDMHQFMGRGIPLAETLAEQMGRNKEEISELVSKGKVGFTEVDKALRSMVEDGGKFANLMDKQSHTIGGLKSNLEDAIDMMFNDIGKQSENLFSSALSAAINVVENYQRIGRAVAELGVAIGSYKALLVALNAVQKISNIYQMQSVKAKAANAAATQGVIIKETGAAIATKMWAKAQAQLNLALKATGLSNPYVALAAAVTAFGFALYKAMTYQTEFEKMMKETEKAAAESTAQANAEILSLETLKGKLAGCKSESEEYLAVKDLIVAKYSKYDETLKEEGLTYDMLVEKLNGVKKAIEESIAARAAEEQLSKNQQKLTEDYAKNIEKLNEKLLKRLSPEMAARAGQEIARALAEGTLEAEADWDRSGILPKTFLNLKGVSAEVAEAVKKASISIGENFDMWSLKIWMAVDNCKNLNKEMRELPQLTYGKFGLDYEQQNQPKEVTASMEMSDKGSKDRISKIRKENAEIADALASGELETARAKIAAMQEGNLKVIAETELQWRKQVAADKLAKDKEYQERVKAQRELNEKSQKMYRDSVIELSNAKIDAESAGTSMVLQNVTGEGKKLSVVLDNIQKEYERTIQKLENEKQKRENEIQDQIRTLEKENEKAGKSKELTPDQQGYINNMREMSNIQYQSGVAEATNKRNEEEKKALDDNVGVWKDYVQKYVELKEKFEKTQKEIMDSKTIDGSAKPKLLENLNEQYANDSKILLNTLGLENDSVRTDIETLILTAYRDATEGAVTKIQEEVLRCQEELKNLSEDGVSEEESEQYRQLQALLAALIKLQTKAEENWKKISGGGTTGNEKLKKSLNGVSRAMAVMNEAISEVRNEFGEMFSEATNDALDLIQTCLTAGKGVMDTLLAAGIATSEGIKEAERGSVILAIIQAAIQVTMALIKVLMNFTKNAQLQKQIDGLKDEIDSIDRLYERAERATKKLSGSEFWRKTIKDTRILNKEIEKYNEAIAAAQELLNNSHTQKAKKKAQEQLDDLVDARNKIEDELADVYTNFYEHFMTTNVEDFSHSLAQNIVDGFSEGLTDLSSVFNDAISDLMKSIIVEQMTEDLRKLFEPAFEQIRWSFNNGDTTFDKNEERFALEALEKAKDQAEGIVDYYKDMFDMLNLDLTDLEASSGAFQGMTQDTAEELNGRFTALQISGASIDLKLDKTNQTLSSLSATASSVADGIALLSVMASNQLTALEEIRDNTSKLNSMDRTLRTMQTSLMTLAGE